jgi:hypothetical protein
MNTQKYQIWALTINQVTDNDLLWLKGLGVDVQSEALINQVYSSGKVVSKYVTGYRIDVITTCDKQETMLKLKYGNDLVLKSVTTSMPASYENLNLVSHSRSQS